MSKNNNSKGNYSGMASAFRERLLHLSDARVCLSLSSEDDDQSGVVISEQPDKTTSATNASTIGCVDDVDESSTSNAE
jgi:hypothetical protein